MPAVIDRYRKEHSFDACTKLQGVLLDTYRNDFGKYAKQTQHKYLKILFEKAPALVGSHFRYSKIDPGLRSRELKIALEQLCYAGLIHRVHATAASGIPLHAQKSEKKFKLLMLDVGLMQRANRVDAESFLREEIIQVDRGRVAEQFVGQELLAYSGFYEDRNLYFWERAARSSSTEVDYVLQIDAKIVPVEVKAGSTGRLRSLRRFMESKRSPIGVQISQAPLSLENGVLSVPFYWIGQLPRLLRESLDS